MDGPRKKRGLKKGKKFIKHLLLGTWKYLKNGFRIHHDPFRLPLTKRW